MAYDWPGNVRELRNVIERLLVVHDEDVIDAAMVSSVLSIRKEPAATSAPREFSQLVPLEEVEREYVQWALKQVNGNVSAAAQVLGVSRSTVYRFLRDTIPETP